MSERMRQTKKNLLILIRAAGCFVGYQTELVIFFASILHIIAKTLQRMLKSIFVDARLECSAVRVKSLNTSMFHTTVTGISLLRSC